VRQRRLFFKVEVKDDDVAGVEVRRIKDNMTVQSADTGEMNGHGLEFHVGEAVGESDAFEVRLSAIPCRNVFISISEVQPGQLQFSEVAKEVQGYLPRHPQLRLSFSRRTWDTWQKVVIYAEDDNQDLPPRVRFTNISVSGVRDDTRADLNDPNFLVRPVRLSLSTVIKDDDKAKLLFEWEGSAKGIYVQNGSYASGVSAEEGDALAKQPSYRLRLATRPFAPVRVVFETPKTPVTHVVINRCPFGPGATNNTPTNVTVNSPPLAQVKTTIISSIPSEMPLQSLIFTPENWQKWVVVKIGALADGITEGPHLGIVSHRLLSTDLNYNGSMTHRATCDEKLSSPSLLDPSAAFDMTCEPLPLPLVAVDITELNWQVPPQLTSAEYDSTGTSVMVVFSGALTTGVGSVACETLFDGVVAKMNDPCEDSNNAVPPAAIKTVLSAFGHDGSETRRCTWITRRSLRIVLGRAATLASGDVLRLKNGAVRSSPTALVYSTDQTVMVSSSKVARPTAGIASKTGSTVSVCGTLFLDASSSHGGGGRPLSYSWRVKNSTADVNSELYANLTGYLAAASSTATAHLNVPASRFLSSGQSYTFVVGVTSAWYPDFVSEAAVSITVATGSVPSVQILGSNEVSLSRIPAGGSVDFKAQWAVQTCLDSVGSEHFGLPVFFSVDAKDTDTGVAQAALTYSCSGTAYDANSPACQQIDTSLHSVTIASRGTFPRLPVTKLKHGLRIPKSVLTPGRTYTIGVLVFLQSEPWRNNTAYATLSIARSDLVARISGGVSMSVPASSQFVLNASASEDPDDDRASLQFAWTCSHAETTEPTICTQPGSNVDTASSSSLAIPAGTFAAGTTVSFTVRVSDSSGRLPAEATVKRLIVAGTPPVVEIEVAPTSRAVDNVDYRTSAGVRIFNEKDTPTFSALVQSSTGSVVYRWSLVTDESDYGSVEGDVSSIWSTPIQGLARARLKPNVLRAPASYKFILRASDASGSTGQSSVVIQMNSPPSNGVLLCSPASGISQKTLFALEAAEWEDTDLPLAYSFFDDGVLLSSNAHSSSNARGSALIRGRELDSPLYETKLSSGEERTLRVIVEDNMGASSEARTTVTVTKRVFVSEAAVEGAVTDAISSLTSKMATGVQTSVLEDPSDMFEAIGLLNENKLNEDQLSSSSSLPSETADVSSSSAKFAENATKNRVALRKSILDQTEQALESLSTSPSEGGSAGDAVAQSDVLLVMSAVSGATASAGESDVELRVKGLNITKSLLSRVKQGGGMVSSETLSLVIDTCSNTLDGLGAAAGAAALDDVAADAAQNASAALNGSVTHEKERQRAALARSREVADQVRSTLASLRDAVMTNAVAGEDALAISTPELSVTMQKVPRRSASMATNSNATNGISANSSGLSRAPTHKVSLSNNIVDSSGEASESAVAEASFELPFSALPDDDDVELLATQFATNIYDETQMAAGTIGLALSQSGVDFEVDNLSDSIVIEFPVSPGGKRLAVPKYWNGSGWDDSGLHLLNLTSDPSAPSGKTHLRFSTNHLTDFSATTIVDPSTIVILANDTAVGLIVDNVLGGTSAFAGASSVPAQTVANLWRSSSGNDVDRLAAHSALFSVVSSAAIPQIVSASVAANPEMANQVAARAVAAAPQLAVEIAVQSVNTSSTTSASAKAVVLSVVNMIRNSTSSHWNNKPLAAIFRSVAVANPALREGMVAAVQDLSDTTQTQTLTQGIGTTLTLDGSVAQLVVPGSASTSSVTVSLRQYDCGLVSSDSGMIGRSCIGVDPHSFGAAVELRFAVSSKATSCIKASDELADNWAYIGSSESETTCTISGGYAYVRSKTWSVLSFREGSGTGPMYVGVVPVGPVAFSRDPQTGFLERREAATGLRSEQTLPNASYLVPGGRTSEIGETTLLGFAVQSDSAVYPASKGLFFSTGSSVRRVEDIDGSTFASAVELVAGVVVVTIKGHSLGTALSDVAMILVKGHICSSVTYVSSNEVGCVSGHPDVARVDGNSLAPSEVSISTVSSGSSEAVPILNWQVRLAEGYSLPIVVSVGLEHRPFRPGAIAVDKELGYVYWGDTLERTIRRSRVDGSFIELVASGTNVGRVTGLALTEDGRTLFYSDSNTGKILRIDTSDIVRSATTGVAENAATLQRKVVISGLDDPRGIALDTLRNRLYFTEKAGRIYECAMDGSNLEPNVARPPRFRDLLLRRPSRVRLDALTLDLTGTRRSKHMIYWAESNTNVIMRSNIFGRGMTKVAGIDGSLVWPRGVEFHDGKLYFSEYLGNIKRIDAPKTLGMSEPLATTLVNSVGAASSNVAQEILAVSRVGGDFVFAINE
jgi:hypothetical protein